MRTFSVLRCKLTRFIAPTHKHTPHPPAPVVPQLMVSSKAEGERAQFLVAGRWESDAHRRRTLQPVSLLSLLPSPILSSSLSGILINLRNTNTFEGKRELNHLFRSFLLRNTWNYWFQNTLRVVVHHFPVNPFKDVPPGFGWGAVFLHNSVSNLLWWNKKSSSGILRLAACKLHSSLRARFPSDHFSVAAICRFSLEISSTFPRFLLTLTASSELLCLLLECVIQSS